MPRKRSWTIEQLSEAVNNSTSYRQVLLKLVLRGTGGNYDQIKKYITQHGCDISHFKGKAWNKGLTGLANHQRSLKDILVSDSDFQSYKLKKRLFSAKLKTPFCENCNWAEKTEDGTIPLELDHINGNKRDNRIENLRVLCPNCHSLTPTYRGRNKRKTRPSGGTGIHATLKML